ARRAAQSSSGCGRGVASRAPAPPVATEQARQCRASILARELERAVVSLVRVILRAQFVEMPPWLVRPGKVECADRWPLVQEVYANLTGGKVLPEVMRPVERREIDAILQRPGEPPRILEFDEKQ